MESEDKAAGNISSPIDAKSAQILSVVHRYRFWIFSLILALHAIAYNGQWRISPDSALYAELGRNLSEGKGFTYHGEAHSWVEPGLPYTIGYSFKHFGLDNFHPIMLGMLACFVASLALTYTLFRLHAGAEVATLVTALLGFSETFFRYGYHLFTDMPFLVAVLAFLVAYELLTRNPKSAIAWPTIVLATVFMVAFRPAVLTFVGAVGLTCAWHVLRGPGRKRHVVLGLVVLASFIGFKKFADPRRHAAPGGQTQRESTLKSLLSDKLGYAIKRMATEWVPMMLEETTPEAVIGLRVGPGISSVVSIGIIAAGVLLARRRMLWGAWVAATVAQMAIWLPRERYFLPILPLLLYALWNAGGWLARKWSPVPVLIAVLLIGPNLVYIAHFIVEQRRTPFLEHYEDGDKLKLISLAEKLSADIPHDATVVAEAGRELSYFSREKVIDPLNERRIALSQKDYDKFAETLAKEPAVYVVLPGKNVQNMVDRIHASLGEAVFTEGEHTVYPLRFRAN